MLQCGHGSDAVETSRRCLARLTSGTSFNAATAVTPWRLRRPGRAGVHGGVGLQCGHGSDAVETNRRGAHARPPW